MASVLVGCASPAVHTDHGAKYKNVARVTGLVYHAEGTAARNAVDDALITIAPTRGDAVGEKSTGTLIPWTKTTVGYDGESVKMTVKSLADEGTVSCNIKFQNVIISNTTTGKNPVAVCEGTLTLDK